MVDANTREAGAAAVEEASNSDGCGCGCVTPKPRHNSTAVQPYTRIEGNSKKPGLAFIGVDAVNDGLRGLTRATGNIPSSQRARMMPDTTQTYSVNHPCQQLGMLISRGGLDAHFGVPAWHRCHWRKSLALLSQGWVKPCTSSSRS